MSRADARVPAPVEKPSIEERPRPVPLEASDPGHEGERRIALVLRWGVLAAAALLGLAWLGSVVSGKSLGHSALPVGALLRGEADGLETTALLGLLTLGITPVARVALSVPVFARSGEKTQALIALGVLALLALSIAVGAVE